MDWYEFKLYRDAAISWVKNHIPKPKLSHRFLLLIVQLAGAAALIYGISLYSHPIAFIIGGIGAVVAMELQSHEKKLSAAEVNHFQSQIKLALSAGADPFADPYNVPLNPAWITYAASLRKVAR